MAEDIIKQMSTKVLAWLLGAIVTLLLTALGGGFKFYMDWTTDEALEEQQANQERILMFDDMNQKQEHKNHVDNAATPFQQQVQRMEDKAFREKMLKALEGSAKIDTLNADQMYQIKEDIKLMQETVDKLHH